MNSGKSVMRTCNSLEVSEKTEIQLFSLLCWIGLVLCKLTLSRGKTCGAVNAAIGGHALTVLGLFLVSKQDKEVSCIEPAIKAAVIKNTMAKTLQCTDRVSIGRKFALMTDQGQQNMFLSTTIRPRMAIGGR